MCWQAFAASNTTFPLPRIEASLSLVITFGQFVTTGRSDVTTHWSAKVQISDFCPKMINSMKSYNTYTTFIILGDKEEDNDEEEDDDEDDIPLSELIKPDKTLPQGKIG